MTTPAQVARLANVTPQTIRNYTREYAHLLSPQASGKAGPRLFTDEDVRVLCTIADLRKSGVPPHEIANHLREDAPTIIDMTPQSPQNADFSPDLPALVESVMVARFDAMQKQIDGLRKAQEDHPRQLERAELRGALFALAGMVLALITLWILLGAIP